MLCVIVCQTIWVLCVIVCNNYLLWFLNRFYIINSVLPLYLSPMCFQSNYGTWYIGVSRLLCFVPHMHDDVLFNLQYLQKMDPILVYFHSAYDMNSLIKMLETCYSDWEKMDTIYRKILRWVLGKAAHSLRFPSCKRIIYRLIYLLVLADLTYTSRSHFFSTNFFMIQNHWNWSPRIHLVNFICMQKIG